MKSIKATIKTVIRKNIVMLLLTANIGAFAITDGIFSSFSATETGGKKNLISQMYTGWQMLDWSFSLVDYLRDITDR